MNGCPSAATRRARRSYGSLVRAVERVVERAFTRFGPTSPRERAVVEPVESRVFLSASLEYRPQNPDGSIGSPVVVTTNLAAEGFSPRDLSLLQTGFDDAGFDLFLAIDGIPGESNEERHPDTIEISAFSWGADAVSSFGSGGAGAGKVIFQSLHFAARTSTQSARLIEALTDGSAHDATLFVRKAGSTQDFFELEIDDAFVGSYQVTTALDGALLDEFTLRPGEVRAEYRRQKPDGTLDSPILFTGSGQASSFVPAQRSLLESGYAAASQDMFLKLAGIAGESKDIDHPGEIEVSAFSWGLANLVSAGTGAEAGIVRAQELHFVAPVSSATPRLLQRAVDGLQIPTATFSVRAGTETDDFYTVTLTGVTVGSHQLTTDPALGLVEEFTLGFGAFTVEVRTQNPDGSIGSPVVASSGGSPISVEQFSPTQQSRLDSGPLGTGPLDAFLDVDGVPGDSADVYHPDEIEVRAFSWGADAVVGTGGGGAVGKTVFHELHVVTRLSPASLGLLDLLADGDSITSVDLTVRRGISSQDFLTIGLDAAAVSSYRLTFAEDGTPLEEFTFRFNDAALPYRPEESTGQLGSPIVAAVTDAEVLDFAPPQDSLIQKGFTDAVADLFLKLDGVPSGSKSVRHPDEIEVLSFAWGADAAGSTSGGGAGAGVSRYQELHFVSSVSSASPTLLQRMNNGTNIPSALFTAERGIAGDAFIQIGLEDAIVSSYQVRPGAGGTLVEEFTLAFGDFEYRFIPQDADGSSGTPVVVARDDVRVLPFTPEQTSILDAPAVASLDVFLAVDGVLGESKNERHRNEIDLLSFSWGGNQVIDLSSGGAGVSKPVFHELHVVLPFSAASPRLFDRMLKGTVIPSIELAVSKSGENPLDFYTITLENVVVSSYQLVTGPDGKLREEVTFSFDESTLEYRPQDPDGSLGTPVVFHADQQTVQGFAPEQESILFTPVPPTTVDLFARIDGIPGESTDVRHRNDIDVLAFSWGGDAAPGTSGGGAGAGKSEVFALHLLTRTSTASPRVLDRLVKGILIPTAVLSVARTTGGDFLKISLADVVIDSYQVSTAPDGTLREEFTLVFGPGGVVPGPDTTPPDTSFVNTPPALTNQDDATFTFTGSDDSTPAEGLVFVATLDGGAPFEVTSPLTLPDLADGTHTLSVAARDASGNVDPTPAAFTWRIDTVAPVLGAASATPSPASVDQDVLIAASVSDLGGGASNLVSGEYTLDGVTWLPLSAADGTFDEPVEAVRADLGRLAAGIHTIGLRATDAAGNTSLTTSLTLPVYDRDAGFVTGGGHFGSPAGALASNPWAGGKAHLNANVNYRDDATIPTGTVTFRFGGLNFASTSLDYLVVVGDTARVHGTGTIGGAGSYSFDLWLDDGGNGKKATPDRVRIRITDDATGQVIYDSGLGAADDAPLATVLGGGNVKVHGA